MMRNDMTQFSFSAVLLVSVISATGCGGTYQARCDVVCDASGRDAVCSAADRTACLQECVARTNELNSQCAACVLDNSGKLSSSSLPGVKAPQTTPNPIGATDAGTPETVTQKCSQPTWEATSSVKCLALCVDDGQ